MLSHYTRTHVRIDARKLHNISAIMKLLFVSFLFFLQPNYAKQQLSLQRDPSKVLRFINFLHLHGHRLNVTANETLEVDRDIQCTSTCLKKQDCFSFNVEKKTGGKFLCEFLNTSKYIFHENLIKDNNFVHWYLQDPCLPSLCVRGSCKAASTEVSGRFCDCWIGTSGKYCDVYVNFALGMPTAQSSVYQQFLSHFAVDGNRTPNLRTPDGQPLCTHTGLTCKAGAGVPWWRVDFGIPIPVARVVVINRSDGWSQRLREFAIKIGNSLSDDGKDNPKCGDRHAVGGDQAGTIMCSPPLIGRYLLIQQLLDDCLTLCEVEVYVS